MIDTYHPYSIELINTALCANKARSVGYGDVSARISSNDLSRTLLPYLFEEVESGWLLPLNRDYKPIGLMIDHGGSELWADYTSAQYRHLFLPKALVDLTLLEKITPAHWYFYGDGSNPFGYATAEDRRTYHLKLCWSLRHWHIPLPKFSPQLLASARRLGIGDALLDYREERRV
jgi:hypothetical protein